MTSTSILRQFSTLHKMQLQLLEALDETDAHKQFHSELPSLNWYFDRGVYMELYWLRERLLDDGELSHRVKHLFTPDAMPLQAQCAQLPPKGHLIKWGSDIRDEHLRHVATPGGLPGQPLRGRSLHQLGKPAGWRLRRGRSATRIPVGGRGQEWGPGATRPCLGVVRQQFTFLS